MTMRLEVSIQRIEQNQYQLDVKEMTSTHA